MVVFCYSYTQFVVNVCFFICVLRTCLCDKLYRRASTTVFPQLYQGRPCYSPSHYLNASPCPNRTKFRLFGGDDGACTESLADERAARRMVKNLVRSYVVFRNYNYPVGGVSSYHGQLYSIRGFFLEADNGAYQFTPPSPLMQIWTINKVPLEPPGMLEPGPFTTIYRSALQIIREGQLSLFPRGVVINAP